MIKSFYCVLLFWCVMVMQTSLQAAPSANLWTMWAEHDPESTQVVSHEKWQRLLDRYLNDQTANGVNLFAYGNVTEADKRLLKTYLQELAALDPRRLNFMEQQAYWVNLYNALTVNVVLKKYPIRSIRKIRFLTSLFGPWDKKLIEIAGARVSLNDIEHRILRPIWQDYRIHFAVNCASIGCPNLQGLAYTASNIEEQLDKAALEFLNHERGMSRRGDQLVLSSLFDWYGNDFAANEAEVVVVLSKYLSRERLSSIEGYNTIVYRYDWQLNDDLP